MDAPIFTMREMVQFAIAIGGLSLLLFYARGYVEGMKATLLDALGKTNLAVNSLATKLEERSGSTTEALGRNAKAIEIMNEEINRLRKQKEEANNKAAGLEARVQGLEKLVHDVLKDVIHQRRTGDDHA